MSANLQAREVIFPVCTKIKEQCLVFPPVHQTRLEELHRLWDLLLQRTKEKGMRLLQAQKLVQYLRECEDAMDWITDKVRFATKRQKNKWHSSRV